MVDGAGRSDVRLGIRPDCWAWVRLKPLYWRSRKGGELWLGNLRRNWLTQLCSACPRADSVAWNPHKLLAAGLQCSALLLQDTSVGLPCPCPGHTAHPGPLSPFLPHSRGVLPYCGLLAIPPEAECLLPPESPVVGSLTLSVACLHEKERVSSLKL